MSCGNVLDQPISAELPSGTSTAVGPVFFVRRSSSASSDSNYYASTRRHQRLRLSLVLPMLLVIAEMAWVLWHTSIPLPESRPLIAAAKVLKRLRSEPKPTVRAGKKTVPQFQASSASATPANSHAVIGTITRTESRRAATQQREKSVETDADNQPDPVIDPRPAGQPTSAAASLEKALAKGDPDAPVRLANMYFTGEGVPQSCDEALSLLLTAARKPNVRARNRLASMYAIGVCVQRDRVQAYRWLIASLALDPNDVWARQNRALTWAQMTPEERNLAEADQ